MLFIESKLQQCLSDEDAVYLIESVVEGLCICKRVLSLLFVRAFNLHMKTSLRCRSSLSVGWLAIQGSLESDASVCAIFITHEHKSTNLKRVTSVSTK